MNNIKQQARWIRWFRWLHRKIAIFLFLFFFIISITGILLGTKKQTGLLAPTQKGSSTDLSTWLPVDSLHKMAIKVLQDSFSPGLSTKLDRIDIRPQKGVVKFVFENHYHGLQLDGTTGKVLLIEKRRSDFIENIHDGTFIDKILGSNSEQGKVSYSLLMGLSLLMLVLSGFWLWIGPKKLRKDKKRTTQ